MMTGGNVTRHLRFLIIGDSCKNHDCTNYRLEFISCRIYFL